MKDFLEKAILNYPIGTIIKGTQRKAIVQSKLYIVLLDFNKTTESWHISVDNELIYSPITNTWAEIIGNLKNIE